MGKKSNRRDKIRVEVTDLPVSHKGNKVAQALNTAKNISEAKPGYAVTGSFPDLYARTADSLTKEYELQEQYCDETVELAQQTTEVIKQGRNVAAENLLKLISDLQHRGALTVPKDRE